LKFNFEATGIGSVPFTDPKKACRIIFDNLKNIPFWPQLPKKSYLENMYVQFAEKFPGLVVDEADKNVYVDTTGVAETIEEFYGKYIEGDLEFFSISRSHAEGLYEFLECLENSGQKFNFLKGQTTGPISFALTVTDQNKKSVIYDKDLFEVLTKMLVMRSRWQIRKLKKYAPNVVFFIDEPYLVSIGSSFVNINIEEAFKKLDELISAVKKEGALCGIHCCGNTDWSLLLKRDIDIINFDAYNFGKEFSLYAADIKNYVNRGGTIAWGIVPSSDLIDKESKNTLADKLDTAAGLLKDKGVKIEDISSIITPSCGLGTLDEQKAEKILEAAEKLSVKLRR